MIRLTFLLFILFFLSNCSISENSRIWRDKEEKVENQKNIKKLFSNEKKIITEFNPELKLDLSKISFNEFIIDNQNNFGAQNYEGLKQKISSYKFSKIEDVNQLNDASQIGKVGRLHQKLSGQEKGIFFPPVFCRFKGNGPPQPVNNNF